MNHFIPKSPIKRQLKVIRGQLKPATREQRQVLHAQAVGIARGIGSRRRVPLGPGTIGSSGRGGVKIQREMIASLDAISDAHLTQVQKMANNALAPNQGIAIKLQEILRASRTNGDLNISAFPESHGALVRVLNKVLDPKSRRYRIVLTKREKEELNRWHELARGQ